MGYDLFECDAEILRYRQIKQKTAYEILRSDWSSDVCSSDLEEAFIRAMKRKKKKKRKGLGM